jgi:hypothetical protein
VVELEAEERSKAVEAIEKTTDDRAVRLVM